VGELKAYEAEHGDVAGTDSAAPESSSDATDTETPPEGGFTL